MSVAALETTWPAPATVTTQRNFEPESAKLACATVNVAVPVPENAAPSARSLQFAPSSVERCQR
ncbi:MAG: hypothetical protein BWX86_02879 [Verrucomicrobia bacterium ADurb.Bin122]|nr:MAG: hypothetical protein BWX86_02879 [Verrucomicrobia bacterium ADurb.Bin122]